MTSLRVMALIAATVALVVGMALLAGRTRVLDHSSVDMGGYVLSVTDVQAAWFASAPERYLLIRVSHHGSADEFAVLLTADELSHGPSSMKADDFTLSEMTTVHGETMINITSRNWALRVSHHADGKWSFGHKSQFQVHAVPHALR